MKKVATALLIVSCFAMCNICFAKTDKEITFREIPWGINYEDLQQLMPEADWYDMSFESMKHYPVSEVLADDDDNSIRFENGGINMVARPFSHDELSVAGYTTSDFECYFAYTADGNALPKDDAHTAMYGARYEFEPMDSYIVYDDLKAKLSSVYGEPDSIKNNTSFTNSKYEDTFWYGANDTAVCLHLEDNSQNEYFDNLDDKIYISYAWEKGDDLLISADNILIAIAVQNESSNFGNNNTDGL